MDTTKAKRVFELSRDNKKILVALWSNDKISSCVTEQTEAAPKSRCESCEGDDELCEQYISHLRDQGYQATEVELGELATEESLPEFLKARQAPAADQNQEKVDQITDFTKEVPDA